MKHSHSIRALGALMIAGLLAAPVLMQTTAQERAASLRQQLAEVQAKQMEMETRLQQLEQDLKPENIEKGLAGVGSTRPEELREQRRRQLEIERKSLQTRLDQLANSRTRLETGIQQADAAAYHSSARPNAVGTEKAAAAKPTTSAQPASAGSTTAPSKARRGNRKKLRRIRRGE